jgi:putative membrane protein
MARQVKRSVRLSLHPRRRADVLPLATPADIAAPIEDHEPDYRFTLANERTFLAWIRTSLALLAGGVALMQLVPRFDVSGVRHVLSVSLVAAGGTLAALAVRRWQRVEQAMRRGTALPASRIPFAVGVALVAMTVVLIVLLFVTPPVGF